MCTVFGGTGCDLGAQVTSSPSTKPKTTVPRVNQRARRLHTHKACGVGKVGKEKRARAARQRREPRRIGRAVACKRAISGLDGLAVLDTFWRFGLALCLGHSVCIAAIHLRGHANAAAPGAT